LHGRISRPTTSLNEPISDARPEGAGAMPSMSALGQKRTLKRLQPMSALPPKADMDWLLRRHSNVFRFGIFDATPELVIECRGRRKTDHHYCVACRRHQIVALFHHFPILAVIKPKLLPPIV